MTEPRGRLRPTRTADPAGSSAPAQRLTALLAEASAPAPGSSAPDPGGSAPGPAHRWEASVRTRVPVPLLLLAVAGVAVLAWAVLGPGGPPTPEGDGGPVLAEVGTDGGTAAGPPVARPAAGPVPASPGTAAASPAQRPAVHVTGEVARPGVVQVDPGARVVDAVEAAGGLTEHAATAAVNLAAPVADGQQVVVPDARTVPAPAPAQAGAAPPPGSGAPGGPVNLNTASVADLEALPEVGPVLAERIVAFRDQQGGFAAVEDLDAVPGIGPAVLEVLLPLVAV